MKKYKIKLYDEMNDIYLLYKQVWWVFYSFVGSGSKEKLEDIVKKKNGTLANKDI